MITGYNTDIEFEGVTYHIQTEDKGLKTSEIVSLVYDGGTILASKRVSYDDLLEGGLNERALAVRLQKLHKTICAAIVKGRIDDLRQMAKRAEPGESLEIPDTVIARSDDPIVSRSIEPELVASSAGLFASDISEAGLTPKIDIPYQDEPVIEAIAITDEPHIVPHEAVTIVSELAGTERPGNTRLNVDLIGDADFFGGQERVVGVMVCRGSERKVVPGAEVMVKVVGSNFRPQVYHSMTDNNGLSMITVQIPQFNSGRATLMLRAMNNGEEVELRRAVTCR